MRTISLPLPMRMGRVNCYLVETDTGHILVDTGSAHSRPELITVLRKAGALSTSLRLILLTHGDFDHTGNANYLRATCAACIAMHPDDAGMVASGDMFLNRKRPHALIKALIPLFTGFGKSERFAPDILLEEGDDLSGYGFAAIGTCLPGHSKGSLGILTGEGDLFCGDFFENIKAPRLNSLIDDPIAAQASLAKLMDFKLRMVYPGHGEPFAWETFISLAG